MNQRKCLRSQELSGDQVQPALSGEDVGKIATPGLIGLLKKIDAAAG